MALAQGARRDHAGDARGQHARDAGRAVVRRPAGDRGRLEPRRPGRVHRLPPHPRLADHGARLDALDRAARARGAAAARGDLPAVEPAIDEPRAADAARGDDRSRGDDRASAASTFRVPDGRAERARRCSPDVDLDAARPARRSPSSAAPARARRAWCELAAAALRGRPAARSRSTAATCATLPLATLRSAIGFVPQDPFLFSRSIRDNIRFGAPEADDAARAARGGDRRARSRPRRAAARLRHHRRRARHHALGRAEAARDARARAARRPDDPDPRRRALERRHRDRAPHPASSCAA